MNAHPGAFTRVARAAPPQRMGFLSRLPVFLALDGRRVMVAGGRPAAAWKVELLSASGASVDVYAARACEDLLLLAAGPPRGAIRLYRRKWNPADLRGCVLAVCDSGDDAEAQAFATAARAAGVPVNVIDKPAFCDFSFGAIVNRSPLVIGISTDGATPLFAQTIRARLEMLLPRVFARWVAAAARWRSALKAAGLTFASRRKFWRLVSAHALIHPDQEPDAALFESLLAQVRGLGCAIEKGLVTVIAAGCGDPELLTLRALRALQSADIILHDDLVSPRVSDFARREARQMLVGRNACRLGRGENDTTALAIDFAKSGKRVVRLTAGDPMLRGRAGAEVAALRAAGIAVEVVPGVAQ